MKIWCSLRTSSAIGSLFLRKWSPSLDEVIVSLVKLFSSSRQNFLRRSSICLCIWSLNGSSFFEISFNFIKSLQNKSILSAYELFSMLSSYGFNNSLMVPLNFVNKSWASLNGRYYLSFYSFPSLDPSLYTLLNSFKWFDIFFKSLTLISSYCFFSIKLIWASEIFLT